MTDRDPAARQRELEELVGRTVAGKYSITRLIGCGGMGAVYEAENVGIGKKVALKFVDREFAKDDRVAGRFAREARAASSIESEHIVQVFDAGSDEGRPYIVMELLRGEDLGSRLRRLGRLKLDEALHIVAQMLRGLARAHAAGIVHRDLKPDNVLLLNRGGDASFVKIVDFGISKIARPAGGTAPLVLTHKGMVMGTPLYMSPEQAQAFSDVDGRADLYSVGAILFECLAGRPPHAGASYEQLLIAICTTDAPDVRAIEPSVPEAVAEFLARALARDRAVRFASASRMLAALHAIAPAERTRVPLDEPLAAEDPPPRGSGPAGPPTSVTWANGARVSCETSTPGVRVPSRIALPITAFVATLTGVAVTMAIVIAMRKAAPVSPPKPASSVSIAAPRPSAAPSAIPSAPPIDPPPAPPVTAAKLASTAPAPASPPPVSPPPA
jgi:serine/threonine-protein kinase